MDFDWLWLLRLVWTIIQALLGFLEKGNSITLARADGAKTIVSKAKGETVKVMSVDKSGTKVFGGEKTVA